MLITLAYKQYNVNCYWWNGVCMTIKQVIKLWLIAIYLSINMLNFIHFHMNYKHNQCKIQWLHTCLYRKEKENQREGAFRKWHE